MTLLPEMLLAGGGMKKLAEACRSRTDQRRQRRRSLVLKTRRVTGPHALPYFEGHRNAFGSRFRACLGCVAPRALLALSGARSALTQFRGEQSSGRKPTSSPRPPAFSW